MAFKDENTPDEIRDMADVPLAVLPVAKEELPDEKIPGYKEYALAAFLADHYAYAWPQVMGYADGFRAGLAFGRAAAELDVDPPEMP